MSAKASETRTDTLVSSGEIDRLNALAAELSRDSLLWSSGYLAGLARARDGDFTAATPTSVAPESAATLTILYASQTGNGERISEQLSLSAAVASLPARVVNLAEYRTSDLKKERAVLLIVSTHGEGDPPDDAEDFYEFLHSDRAPKLAELNFAVLALGDSSYEHFCKTGRDFDERLHALGASRLAEIVECDLDYDAKTRDWSASALALVAPLIAENEKSGPTLKAVAGARYTADHPYVAELVKNQKITGRNSDKDVRHIEFDIEGSGLVFEPGDSLGVISENPPGLVRELIAELGLAEGTSVSELEKTLRTDYEITVASVAFAERYAQLANAADLQLRLEKQKRAELIAWLNERQIIDIVREYPSKPDGASFLSCLRPLKPRLYSIASSATVNPDQVAITVSAVRYTAFGSEHYGAASTHLADRLQPGDRLGIYVERNPRFRLPKESDRDLIMIGPGTGVAPFRAFLEEREASAASGRTWLFFGDRQSREDFLYQLDWARFRKREVLTRMDVAFSRDQAEKVYVQHRLLERAEGIFEWLENGAAVYVCGDASQMAADVHAALLEVIARGTGLDISGAEQYLKTMKREGRYQRDVY